MRHITSLPSLFSLLVFFVQSNCCVNKATVRLSRSHETQGSWGRLHRHVSDKQLSAVTRRQCPVSECSLYTCRLTMNISNITLVWYVVLSTHYSRLREMLNLSATVQFFVLSVEPTRRTNYAHSKVCRNWLYQPSACSMHQLQQICDRAKCWCLT